MLKIPQRGDKSRNSKIKCEILKYLANGNHSASELRRYLNKEFSLSVTSGIDKQHVRKLQEWRFLDHYSLVDDYQTFREIIFFIEKNNNIISWDISEFSHNTEYGKRHINYEVIDRWLEESFNKFYDEKGKFRQKYTNLGARRLIAGGLPRDQLLLAAQISPNVLLYFLHTENITFQPNSNNILKDQHQKLIELMVKDIMSERKRVDGDLFNRKLEIINDKESKRKGFRIDFSFEIYPRIQNKEEQKDANS